MVRIYNSKTGKRESISSVFPNKYRISYVLKTPTGIKRESVYLTRRTRIVPVKKNLKAIYGKQIGKFKTHKL